MVKSFPPLFSGKMMRMNRLSERNPTQKPIEACPRKSQDRRTVSAWEIYEMFQQGHIEVFKTTRAGATTSLNAESGNRDEKFTCIVPTNKIADETIVRDSINFCEKQGLDVIHIQSNMNCIKNQELCEEYPDLKELQYLPLADKCEDCEHYDYCPITAPLRRPNANGFVLTYAKVAALQLAVMSREGTTAEKILNSIAGSRNIILDEVHELQYGRQQEYIVYDNKNGYRTDFNKYNSACQDFEYIKNVIEQMKAIAEDDTFKIKVHEVLGGAESPKYWNHRLSLDYQNPAFTGQERDARGKETAGFIKELIELTKHREDYNLSMEEVKALLQFNAIGKSFKLSINAIKDRGIIQIKVSALDFLYVDTIRKFTMSMQGEGRRIILTTATFCSKDYSDFFRGKVSPLKTTFGQHGDPTNNNEKMLILADNKKYNAIGDRSRYKMRPEIISRCIDILESYEEEEVLIIALSKEEAWSIERGLKQAGRPHPVIYYKGSETIGVTSKARIMIAIGIANKPLNSFDPITETVEDSKKLLYESIHCDTWQAWSRVKDPDGKENSLVFALGCCIDDVRACVKWGFNRKITGIEEHRNGCRNRLTIEYEGSGITEPKVIHCKDFEDMKQQGLSFKQSKKQSGFQGKPSIQNIIDGSCQKHPVFLDSPLGLLKLQAFRKDAYGVQQKDGSYLAETKFPLTERDLEAHISGSKTIGAYQLGQDSMIRWFAFDVDSHAPRPKKDKSTGKLIPVIETPEEVEKRDRIAEENKERLFNTLTALGIPFIFEASGSPHSYHFIVFLSVPVPAKVAVYLGEEIKKIAGLVGDIELFPKQKTLNQNKKYGNLLKCLFAVHRKTGIKSKIWINGEFQESFSGLEIQTIDISAFTLLSDIHQIEVKEKAQKAKRKFKEAYPDYKPVKEGFIRPCFISAQKLQMNHGDGNQFRIAVAGELYRAGYPLDVAVQYFKYQSDFNEEETRYRLSLVYDQKYHRTEQEKLKTLCTRFVNCDNCGYDGVCDFI